MFSQIRLLAACAAPTSCLQSLKDTYVPSCGFACVYLYRDDFRAQSLDGPSFSQMHIWNSPFMGVAKKLGVCFVPVVRTTICYHLQ